MRGPSLRGSRLRRITVVIITFGLVIMVFSSIAQGATHPKTVRGYAWDSLGNPLDDASITVNIKDGETILSTKSELTNSDGFYSLVFSTPQWDIGNTIEVIATYDSYQETNSTTADDSVVQWVNVTFPFEIPIFGSIIGFLFAGMILGIIAIVAIRAPVTNSKRLNQKKLRNFLQKKKP